MNVLEINYPAKKVKIMHEDCLDCGDKFTPQPYNVHGAIGGFFCEKCIKKDKPATQDHLADLIFRRPWLKH